MRAGEAQEVPGGAGKAVHRIGFPLGGATAVRGSGSPPRLPNAGQRGATVTGRLKVVDLRQPQRQLASGTATGPQAGQWTMGIGAPQ